MSMLWDASAIKTPLRFARCARRWGRISPPAWGTVRGQVHLGSGFRAYRCRATTHLAIYHHPSYERQGSHHIFLAVQPHMSRADAPGPGACPKARVCHTPTGSARTAPTQREAQRTVCRTWSGTRPGCVQYQLDLRCACGPQDGRKLTKNIDPGLGRVPFAPFFFREPV